MPQQALARLYAYCARQGVRCGVPCCDCLREDVNIAVSLNVQSSRRQPRFKSITLTLQAARLCRRQPPVSPGSTAQARSLGMQGKPCALASRPASAAVPPRGNSCVICYPLTTDANTVCKPSLRMLLPTQ